VTSYVDAVARDRGVDAGRERLCRGLLARGSRVPPSHANGLWPAEPDRVEECRTTLTRAGVQARYRLGEGVRLTAGDRPANDAVLTALGKSR
jgi:histidinol-phosphate aminotransferase